MSLRLEATLTCPSCGTMKVEVMPTDACQYFYECSACSTLLKLEPGGLLCVLLLWIDALPADSTGQAIMVAAKSGAYLQTHSNFAE